MDSCTIVMVIWESGSFYLDLSTCHILEIMNIWQVDRKREGSSDLHILMGWWEVLSLTISGIGTQPVHVLLTKTQLYVSTKA